MQEGARQRDHRIRQQIEANNRAPLGVRGWILLLACIVIGPFLVFTVAILLGAPFLSLR